MAHLVGFTKVLKFADTWFWAERGLIHLENENTGDYNSISVEKFRQRVQAIVDMIPYSGPHDTKRFTEFADKAEQIIEQAINQGQPSIAADRREVYRRRPKSFVVPINVE